MSLFPTITNVKINCNEFGQFLNIQITAYFDNWNTEIHEYDIDDNKDIQLQVRKASHDFIEMVRKIRNPNYVMKPYDGFASVEKSVLWCLRIENERRIKNES